MTGPFDHARHTGLPGTLPIETALESTFHEGITFAPELLEEEGYRELAGKVRMQVQQRA